MSYPKYQANFEFEGGKSASATDNNLARLKKRIANNFAGEVTEWGLAGGQKIVHYRIERTDEEHTRIVEDSRDL